MGLSLLYVTFLLAACTTAIWAIPSPESNSSGTNCGLFPGAEAISGNENLQSFPGFGWDNLRNLPMAAVLDIYSYKTCRMSPDRKHIVPDYVDVIPVKKSTLDRFAEFYQDFREYYHSTAESINFQAGAGFKGVGISGSYSDQYQETKRMSLTTSTSIMRTKVDHHAYSLIAEPDAPLEAIFKQRIMEIADALRLNKTNLAKYLGQVLVRDYGTHIVTRVEAGSIVSQDDYADKTLVYSAVTDLDTARAAAAASFFNVVNFQFSTARTMNTTTINQYNQIVKHSLLRAHGGPDFSTILTTSSWFNSTLTDLVALDRAGDPIYWYITNAQIPELPEPMIEHIQQLVQSAVQQYYDENTVPGCTNPDAPNFKYVANLEDGSCSLPFSNFSFGGVFQKCTVVGGDGNPCDGLVVDNGEDGSLFCPDDFSPEILVDDVYSFSPHAEQRCSEYHYFCWKSLFTFGIVRCSRKVCNNVMITNKAHIQTYWCNATKQVAQKTGYMFAGGFSDRRLNPFTNEQSCPGRFFSIQLGAGSDSFSICLSRDYELDYIYSVPFGGFLSCKDQVHRQCHNGYSQHLLTRIKDCEIYYCIRTGVMKEPGYAAVHRPPFMPMPYDYQALMALYSYPDGRLWVWDDEKALWTMGQDNLLSADDALDDWVAYMNKTVTEAERKDSIKT